jgi:4-carboxymuconolactone decarboxylase
MARIPYFDLAQAQPELAELVAQRRPLNIYRMLAHGGNVAVGFLRLGGAILRESEIDPHLRELVILRAGGWCDATYEMHQHKRLARSIGVPEEKIAAVVAVRQDLPPGLFDERETVLIRFVDELVNDVKASDETFKRMCELFPYKQVVEAVLTTGFYMMVSRFLETFEVDIEEAQ